jgi:hypothetical protein
MIEIEKKNTCNDKRPIVAKFNSLEDLIRYVLSEHDLATFGYSPLDRTNHCFLFREKLELEDYNSKRYCYVCYDDGKLVTPDILVGLYRKLRPKYRRYSWWAGYKRSFGNYWRRPKTTQEKRWYSFEKHDKLKLRAKRNVVNLPDMWDDIRRHRERCWKNTRKTQYK